MPPAFGLQVEEQVLEKRWLWNIPKEGIALPFQVVEKTGWMRRKKKIGALGGTCLSVVCDVVDVDSIQKALEEIDREWGRIDIVVANAGFSMSARIETLTFEDWRRQLDVNVIGLAQTARYALPYLEKTKGRVVLISSVMASMRYEKSGAYSASKAAVTAIGETLSLELLGNPVTSTVIHPGYVESEIGQVQTDGKFDPNAKDRRPSKMLWPADKACAGYGKCH